VYRYRIVAIKKHHDQIQLTMAAALRWSGHETKAMKAVKSSLLFPSDAQYDVLIKDTESVPQDVDPNICPPFLLEMVRGVPPKTAFGVIQIQVTSKSHACLPVLCTLAATCFYSPLDHEQFSEELSSRQEYRRLTKHRTSQPMSQYDWPVGIQPLECCPVCGQNAQPPSTRAGSKRYLLFYPISQQLGAPQNGISCPLIVSRIISRLVCMTCLDTVLADKIPSTVDHHAVYQSHFRGRPILQSLRELSALPFVQRSGIILQDHPNIQDAFVMQYVWKILGLFRALEARESALFSEKMAHFAPASETVSLGIINDGRTSRSISSNGEQQQRQGSQQQHLVPGPKRFNWEKKCLVCLKVDPSNHCCSRCHWAVYCSKACQKKDWKRHKVVDCKPVAT
jgi:MYND finger